MGGLLVTQENIGEMIANVRKVLAKRSSVTQAIDDTAVDLVVRLTVRENMHPMRIASGLGISLGSVLRILSRKGVPAAGVRHRGRDRREPDQDIDEETFGRMLEMKRDGAASIDAAIELGVKLRVINCAWPYPSYASYKKLR